MRQTFGSSPDSPDERQQASIPTGAPICRMVWKVAAHGPMAYTTRSSCMAVRIDDGQDSEKEDGTGDANQGLWQGGPQCRGNASSAVATRPAHRRSPGELAHAPVDRPFPVAGLHAAVPEPHDQAILASNPILRHR
ncbi:abi family domain protein [Burkholderia cepacia]|nr:abi family domain protein [Burkholderia cepacia]